MVLSTAFPAPVRFHRFPDRFPGRCCHAQRRTPLLTTWLHVKCSTFAWFTCRSQNNRPNKRTHRTLAPFTTILPANSEGRDTLALCAASAFGWVTYIGINVLRRQTRRRPQSMGLSSIIVGRNYEDVSSNRTCVKHWTMAATVARSLLQHSVWLPVRAPFDVRLKHVPHAKEL
jgi:hypothetical protein